MIGFERMSFHEATVTRFCRYDAALDLELDDVLVDGIASRVILKISPVFYVKIDGEFSNNPLMKLNDGEVLSLDITEDGVSAVIEWNDFSEGVSVIREYRVSGGGVSVTKI